MRYPAARILVYTGDTDAAPDMILAKARDRFNMQIPDTNLEFVYLHKRRYLVQNINQQIVYYLV